MEITLIDKIQRQTDLFERTSYQRIVSLIVYSDACLINRVLKGDKIQFILNMFY